MNNYRSAAVTPEPHVLDQHIQAAYAKLFFGLSPVSLALAHADWLLNLATSPGLLMDLQLEAFRNGIELFERSGHIAQNCMSKRLNALTGHSEHDVPMERITQDQRYSHQAWEFFPWLNWIEAHTLGENWWQHATQLRGMRPHSQEQMRFYASKWLDFMAPGNTLLTNPQAMDAALRSNGQSLIKGMKHAVDEWQHKLGLLSNDSSDTSLRPGHGLAMTPGEVVMRNHMVELIQYAPTTPRVHAQPILIVPSCIMKYYILDLSPHNSMVRWLVSQGHTVYILSWRNPDENDALLLMDDYVQEGVLAGLQHVADATGERVHLMGYCLGGTFAAMATAVLERERVTPPQERTSIELASLTLLAAETDFREPGEMGVLIDDAQVRMLEDMMAETGYLSGRQMAGSFQFLHSRELVWSSQTRRWLLGEEEIPNDLMIWNADVTRLPAAMHSRYLRQCFLHNDLASGNLELSGRPVNLRDIHLPVFAVGTVKDHVAPWRSVYKLHRLVSSPVTFVLTTGGHNAGIISEPGHAGRHYQLMTLEPQDARLTQDEWADTAPGHEGSWWTAWSEWLIQHGDGRQLKARTPIHHDELGAAPGHYVMVRYDD